MGVSSFMESIFVVAILCLCIFMICDGNVLISTTIHTEVVWLFFKEEKSYVTMYWVSVSVGMWYQQSTIIVFPVDSDHTQMVYNYIYSDGPSPRLLINLPGMGLIDMNSAQCGESLSGRVEVKGLYVFI